MADFIFSGEPGLGDVVDLNFKVFCNWSPKVPIKNVYKVTRDVCGHKFSTICGFTFTSSLDVPFFVKYPELKLSLQYGIDSALFYKIFLIVYCPKSRSNYVRNDRGLSGWYIWQHRAVDNKQIMSLNDLYAYYGFDLSKFFLSDVFAKYLPLFKKQITAAYGTTVKEFVDGMNGVQFGYSQNEAKFFSRCVFDSLAKIGDVLKVNWEKPDEKKAKLAYNADDTYSLNTKNVKNLDQVSGVDATGTEMKTDESDETFEADSIVEEELDEVAEMQDVVEEESNKEECKEAEVTNEDILLKEESEEKKSERLWKKAQDKMSTAAKALEDVAEYLKIASEANEFDKTFISNEDPGMQETDEDIKNAFEAIGRLRSALHFPSK